MAEYLEANTLFTLYGDAKDSKQRTNWTTNYSSYNPKIFTGRDKETQLANLNMINQMSGKLSDIYSAELSSLGLSSDKFMDTIRRVAYSESSLYSRQTSQTGVVGLMQVTGVTARDLIQQGIVGKKAIGFLKMPKDLVDVIKKTDIYDKDGNVIPLPGQYGKQLRDILSDDKKSVVFGAGKITQAGMKYRNDKKPEVKGGDIGRTEIEPTFARTPGNAGIEGEMFRNRIVPDDPYFNGR